MLTQEEEVSCEGDHRDGGLQAPYPPPPSEVFVVLTGADGQCGHSGSAVTAHARTCVSLLCS